jgi:hypothetical protein
MKFLDKLAEDYIDGQQEPAEIVEVYKAGFLKAKELLLAMEGESFSHAICLTVLKTLDNA